MESPRRRGPGVSPANGGMTAPACRRATTIWSRTMPATASGSTARDSMRARPPLRAGSCTGCSRGEGNDHDNDEITPMPRYAELAVTTNFSFLRGAAHPREMVARADELGLAAIGIADRNSFAGVVRAYDEAKKRNIKLLVGTRLVTTDGFEVIAYPTDRDAYGRLCRLLTQGNRKAKKGECHLGLDDILATSEGQMLICLPPDDLAPRFTERLAALAGAAPGRAFLAGIH